MSKLPFNIFQPVAGNAAAFFILCSSLFASCQPAEQQDITADSEPAPVAVADTGPRRPAPEFYIIPPGMERKRVWVCDDNRSDILHVSNTCEVLKACAATIKNVSLQRAIEDYDRYNCTVCSKDLADIYDDEKIR